jgi:hypothetical protein
MGKTIIVFIAMCMLLLPGRLMAASFDGSSPMICAVVGAFECSLEKDCFEVTVETMNIPQFIKVDVANKKIGSPEESENKKETAIRNVSHNNGSLVLQGAENGRGWSIVIAEETGKMSGAISEAKAGFIILGACMLD